MKRKGEGERLNWRRRRQCHPAVCCWSLSGLFGHCESKFAAVLHAGRQVTQITRHDLRRSSLTSWGVLCKLFWCRDEAVAECCKLISGKAA